MALIGGGGAGNVAGGSNPAGIGSSISFIGNGVWGGWSGNTSGGAKAFDFTSPLTALYAEMDIGFDLTATTINETFGIEVKLDGQVVYVWRATRAGSENITTDFSPLTMVIPGNSHLEVSATSQSTAVDLMTVMFYGREI
jgi:hypothetical protein|tara:strand:+ start:265 stop:684 length:420 start_codon:yes stop_codon:yes gene_type:complete